MTITKMQLKKDQPHLLERFAAQLSEQVESLEEVLRTFFEKIMMRHAGKPVKDIALNLFESWSTRGGVVPPTKCVEYAASLMSGVLTRSLSGEIVDGELERIYYRLHRELGFPLEKIREFVDSSLSRSRDLVTLREMPPQEALLYALKEHIWGLYSSEVDNFIVQTSHVILARLLLYRVGEDKKLFPQRLSDDALERMRERYKFPLIRTLPALDLLLGIRREMERVAPIIYTLSEFDWWSVPRPHLDALTSVERECIERFEETFDQKLFRVFRIFDSYDFREIDRDAWKDVYQHYLPEEERQRLGGFYTPDEIVELILDLVGYVPTKEGLCGAKILDPACGSGTFLVEAVRRLREHLERPMKCHLMVHQRKTSWEICKEMLDIIRNMIYGVDIHPFATFLTTTNLFFQLIELYVDVKHKYPDYTLKFNIITHDSLERRSPLVTITLEGRNTRVEEALRRASEYNQIRETEFDYLVGNPPWGGVLKGKLSPLHDPEKRRKYKREYISAYGKYDIYVLFMERGIEWLCRGGHFGMVTQNTYLEMAFGTGIRHVLTNDVRLTHIIDLGEVGNIFFPRVTNYPAITIAVKEEPDPESLVLVVKVKREAENLGRTIVEKRRRIRDEVLRAITNIHRR
jgi:DNA-binding transcriptional MerR regulator